MNREYTCYCGLYCENCAVKVKVEPASKVLYDEMKKAGFEDIMQFLPDGDKFWSFLKKWLSKEYVSRVGQEVEIQAAKLECAQK